MRSIIGVVLGYAVLATLIGVKFVLLQQYVPSAFTDPGWLTFIVLSDGLSAFLAGCVLSAVVRRREMTHAMILVGVLAALGILNAFANAGREPLSFQLSTLAVMSGALPLGAWLRASTSALRQLQLAHE